MPSSSLTSADLPNIQGLVLNGYGHHKCSVYVFLKANDGALARSWLQVLIPSIRTCKRRGKEEERPDDSVNIALTLSGLEVLGLPSAALAEFPTEFTEGMAGAERPRVLGDTGDCAPETWEFGGPNNGGIDILLMIFGIDDEIVSKRYLELSSQFAQGGLVEVYRQDTGRISNYEPFGFHDGISQPAIAGAPGKQLSNETPLNAGEFLLGYTNGYNTPGSAVLVDEAQDTANQLPAAEDVAGSKDFSRDGTFLVFRKLEQDVKGFWDFLHQEARRLGHVDDGDAYAEWLGAKFIGRWKDGSPLVQSPDKPHTDPKTADVLNNFLYMDVDPDGLRCPVGAHIRRANPRDSLTPNPNRSKVVSNRHRLIRRGRHYEDKGPSGTKVGLCFIALNADIQRQFEFVQQTWLNSSKFNGLFDVSDPLVGTNDGTTPFSIPMSPARLRINGIPRFIRTKGGGYFFMPSINALRFLAK